MAAFQHDPEGIEITNPVTGSLMTLRQGSGRETAEAILEIEAWLPAGWSDVFRHLHPLQEERVHVLEGKIVAEIDGWSRTYSAGETFIVPVGLDHSLTAQGGSGAHTITEVTPPLRTAELLTVLQNLASAGLVNNVGWPNRLPAAIVTREFADEFVLTAPPALLRPSATRFLLPVARAFGYGRLIAGFGSDAAALPKPHIAMMRPSRSER